MNSETEFATVKLMAKNVTFLGWLKNGRSAVFQTEEGELYTAHNYEAIEDLKIGSKGSIIYKANAFHGSYYFEGDNKLFII